MATAMRTRVIRIGNSRGIRIPRELLEQVGLDHAGSEVELEVQDGQLSVRPAPVTRHARAGWDEAFRVMAEHGDDELLDADAPALTEFDARDWEW